MELLTIKEVAEILRISRQAASKAISDGRIKSMKIGGQYRISREWLEQYIKNGGDAFERSEH